MTSADGGVTSYKDVTIYRDRTLSLTLNVIHEVVYSCGDPLPYHCLLRFMGLKLSVHHDKSYCPVCHTNRVST